MSYGAGVTFGKGILMKMEAFTNPVMKAVLEAPENRDTKASRDGFLCSGRSPRWSICGSAFARPDARLTIRHLWLAEFAVSPLLRFGSGRNLHNRPSAEVYYFLGLSYLPHSRWYPF